MEASWAKVMEIAERLRKTKDYAEKKSAGLMTADMIAALDMYPTDDGRKFQQDIQDAVDIFLQLTAIDWEAFIITGSGHKVKLYRCTPDDIRTDDIVRGLCNESRFCGQTPRPLPVACHLLNGLDMAIQRGVELRWLLHDVEEAYLGDLPAPIKGAGINLPYSLAADHIQEQAAKRYGIEADDDEEKIVKGIDTTMLELEQQWRKGNSSMPYDRWSDSLAYEFKQALNKADADRYF